MVVVEVFADITCPFTHVGLRRVVQRRAELGGDFALHVRAWPLELVNGAPLDPQLVAEKVAALRAGPAPDLFTGFDPARFPETSLPALALAAAAYRVDVATGELASLVLRDALFEEGADLTNHRELRSIAAVLGLSVPLDAEDDVFADFRDGKRRGVSGSPHFFVGDHQYFCPSLRIGHAADGALEVVPDTASLEAFIRDCSSIGDCSAPSPAPA